jgi:hypothetical protein
VDDDSREDHRFGPSRAYYYHSLSVLPLINHHSYHPITHPSLAAVPLSSFDKSRTMLAHACSRPTARPRYPSSLSASHRGELSGVKTVVAAPTVPRAQAIVEQSFYPTPPPSPDLIDVSVLPAEKPTDGASTAVDSPTAVPSPAPASAPAPTATPIRIPLLLNTHHPLPHAATLRLDAPSGILAALGGNRVLSLDAQTVWDRMPYSAVTAVVATRDALEEDAVEMIIGGKRPERRANGIHRGVTAVK